MADFDYLIIGAGAAGLLLCQELATHPGLAGRRIAVVDDGSFPIEHRAWGYWTSQHRPIDGIASAAWSRVDVFAQGGSRRLTLDPYRYLLIRGGELEAWVAEASTSGNVTRIHDRIQRIDGQSAAASCVGEIGEYSASLVFDSRPPPHASDGAVRLQFLGWELKTADDAFDPAVATFMDFRLAASGRVQFGYVLPTAPNRALVELAAFATQPLDPTAAGDELESYLRQQLGIEHWDVHRREFGDLRLTVESDWPENEFVVDIGRRGGLLRPSTGYGFDRMARHAKQIAGALAASPTSRDGLPFEPNKRHSYLDRVLLDVVAAHPAVLEPTFDSLFSNNPPTRILRFLDEDSTMRDEAKIVSSMPKTPFVRAAARVRRRTPKRPTRG